MEVVIDWVNKVALRLPLVKEWMHSRPDLWSYIIEWLKEFPEPPNPQYQDRHSTVRLNKPRSMARASPYRYILPRRNQALNFYRRHILVQIKQGSTPDLSHEVDIDYYHLDDFKLVKD